MILFFSENQKCRLSVFLFLTIWLVGIEKSDAQRRDSTLFFKSSLSVTQNGFSLIPSFSLGKPAIIFEPSIGNKRMSFEPQFRFGTDGKPWSFIFIYRYKLINNPKFSLHLGSHIPALIFATQTVTRNGVVEDLLITNRFLAGEIITNHTLSNTVSMGIYLLRGKGYNSTGVRDSYYAGFRTTFSSISLTKDLYMQLNPQLYYLKTDENDGVYFTNTFNLRVKNFPIYFSNIINKAIKTTIPGKQFDWNLSLVYAFDHYYKR